MARKICILTFGTRGDVQPYVALGLGLKAAGYEVTIATLAEFKPLVMDYGLQHDALRGDFLKAAQTAEGKSALEGRGNPIKLLRQYIRMARDTLEDEWASAQKADVLIYNSAALGGYPYRREIGRSGLRLFPRAALLANPRVPQPVLALSRPGTLQQNEPPLVCGYRANDVPPPD